MFLVLNFAAGLLNLSTTAATVRWIAGKITDVEKARVASFCVALGSTAKYRVEKRAQALLSAETAESVGALVAMLLIWYFLFRYRKEPQLAYRHRQAD